MQWNQIKTLFIICFLILDVYLMVKFFDKQEETDISVLEQEETSIEQRLESDDISLPELSDEEDEEDEEEHYISASPRKFSDDDIDKLDHLKNQETAVIDDQYIISEFKDPVSIPVGESSSDITDELSDLLIYGDDYEYWGRDESLNMLVLFQEKNDQPIYYNKNGIILVFLNDDDEAIFYVQTMLDDVDTDDDEYTLIKPMKAIETLYDSNELKAGDDVTNINMGFHTRVPMEDDVQVFSPTWRVTVNEGSNYFVNAIEGLDYKEDTDDFMEDSLESITEKADVISDKDLKKDITKLLDKRINVLKEGDSEE